MATPQHVYLARPHAYQRIFDESRNSPGRETGGILVGRTFHLTGGSILVVVAASGPGVSADRQGHTYAPDTFARQRELDSWREEYKHYQVDYVGEWHKHPPGYRQPSAGDTGQVIQILGDSSYSLPDGIFTPLVTIEDGRFMLHGYYYSREAMRAEPVECVVTDDDIRRLLDQLLVLERQSGMSDRGADDSAIGRTRWGVTTDTFKAARAALTSNLPDAEVIAPERFDPDAVIIDMYGYIQPARGLLEPNDSASPLASDPASPPVFPDPPTQDQIPAAPPLPGRSERELSELRQYCATKKMHVNRQQRDDRSSCYEITFSRPLKIDAEQLLPARQYQTPEGAVAVELPESEPTVAIDRILLGSGSEFPDQPPLATLMLSDERRLHISVERLFPAGWRSHIRMRDVLKALLDALEQPTLQHELGELIEYHGRLVIRQAETFFRSVADICADLNRHYSFKRSDSLGQLDQDKEG
jgi:hypothetical protein